MIHRGFGRMALAITTVSLGLVGFSVATSNPTGAVPSVTSLGHFLCYTSGSSGATTNFKVPGNLLIKNAIEPSLISPSVSTIDLHCNPTIKAVSKTATGPLTIYPVKNQNDHLLCWHAITKNSAATVAIANQFGTAVMSTGLLAQLCLPSWKSLTGPPNQPNPTPPGLDHFACYPLTKAGAYRFIVPARVLVRDQFARSLGKVTVGVAQLLCVPTTKIANGISYSPIGANDQSLTCFSVSRTPLRTQVFDQNQFGQGAIHPIQTKYLCLPSTIALQPKPLDHFLCYYVHATPGPFLNPHAVEIQNVLQPLTSTIAATLLFHCNPTAKEVAKNPTGLVTTYPINNPVAHLLCWQANAANPAHKVAISNQFGTSNVVTGSLVGLCLPTWKSLVGLPNKTPVAPPGLDHFACYPIHPLVSNGFVPPGLVRVQDEFASSFTRVAVGVAQILCVPTTKFDKGVAYRPASANDESLTCFQVTQTPFKPKIFDQNQFGESQLYPVQTRALCLPSKIHLLP